MVSVLSSLLFAASATAQITTSIAIYGGLGTDKLGFYGSIINVSGPNTTLAVIYDNGTNTEAVGVMSRPQTVTVSPTLFEFDGDLPSHDNNSRAYNFRCDLPSNAEPDCTVSYNSVYAKFILCAPTVRTTSTGYVTYVHTYPARLTYSAGVETVVRTYAYGGNTRPQPTWCTEDSFPQSGYVEAQTIRREQIAMYQVIVTAGAEKLSATQGASASSSGPNATAAGTISTSTGAAMPMKTVGPVVMGLGAVAAAFL